MNSDLDQQPNMANRMRRAGEGPRAALVATLGTRPQVVTLALDLLLDAGTSIDEVVVIHTAGSPPRPGQAPPARDWMAESVKTVQQQFDRSLGYLHRGVALTSCRLTLAPLEVEGRPIDDIHDQQDARSVFSTIFALVRDLKRKRYVIHLSIAGGRKSMSVYGMAVAQLLFDGQDRLWHLLSSPEFETLNQLHARTPEDAQLVRIPVLPVSTVFPGMVTVMTRDDPLAVLERQETVLLLEEQRNRREFLETNLTKSERTLVDALMTTIVRENRALSNNELARKLVIRPSVVGNRFSEIYAKLRDYLGLPITEQVDRSILVYYLTPFYVASG